MKGVEGELTVKQIAAKLIASSEIIRNCQTCLGAGYHWVTISDYILPVICTCKATTKGFQIEEKVVKRHHNIRKDITGAREDDTPEYVYKNFILSDVVPAKESIIMHGKINDILRMKEGRDKILSRKINESNVDTIIAMANELYGRYSVDIHDKISALIKGGVNGVPSKIHNKTCLPDNEPKG